MYMVFLRNSEIMLVKRSFFLLFFYFKANIHKTYKSYVVNVRERQNTILGIWIQKVELTPIKAILMTSWTLDIRTHIAARMGIHEFTKPKYFML